MNRLVVGGCIDMLSFILYCIYLCWSVREKAFILYCIYLYIYLCWSVREKAHKEKSRSVLETGKI